MTYQIGDIVRTIRDLRTVFGPTRPDDFVPSGSFGKVKYLPKEEDKDARNDLGVTWYDVDSGHSIGMECRVVDVELASPYIFTIDPQALLPIVVVLHDDLPRGFHDMSEALASMGFRQLTRETYGRLLAIVDPDRNPMRGAVAETVRNLRHAWKDLNFQYEGLTEEEKKIIPPQHFRYLAAWARKGG